MREHGRVITGRDGPMRQCRVRGRGPIPYVIVLAAVVMAIAGCTTVPHQDFAAYRHAFAEAREASKPIIHDLGLAWLEAEAIEADDDDEADDDWEQFDPDGPPQPLTIDEQVMIRHQLWVVVHRYNEALAALAEGRSPEQVEGLVDGFLSSVRDLPIRRLADMAAGAQPLAGVISDALFLIEREVMARQFRRAVEAGGPLVEKILIAKQQEINDHYNLRLVLNRRARRGLEEILQMDLIPSFIDIYESTGAHDDKPVIEAELNDALRTRFRYREHQLLDVTDATDAPPPSPAELSQLVMIAGDVKAKGGQFAGLREELHSYQQVLKSYHALLAIVRHRMNLLQEAAEHGGTVSTADLLLAADNLHWFYSRYRNAREGR